MKRLFLVLLAVVLMAGNVWADATATSTLTPKSGKLDFMSGGAVAVTDQTNGHTLHVDSAGAASVMEYPKTIATGTAAEVYTGAGGGKAMVSSACRVSSITYGSANSAAGDYLLVYDAASVTGTPKFDLSIGTAQSTEHFVIPGGATFSTGVYAIAYGTNGINATITYDN